jgi:hypothetical protein
MPDQISIENTHDSAFALAEYAALRDEVLKRIEFQNQILNLTLIILGTFVSVGYQLSNGPVILLIYPLIACILSFSWEQHNLRIRQIGVYIRERIESRTSKGGWEQYRVDIRLKRTGTALFARLTFIITQLATIFLSWWLQRSLLSGVARVLIVVDAIAVFVTYFIIRTLPLEPGQAADQRKSL